MSLVLLHFASIRVGGVVFTISLVQYCIQLGGYFVYYFMFTVVGLENCTIAGVSVGYQR